MKVQWGYVTIWFSIVSGLVVQIQFQSDFSYVFYAFAVMIAMLNSTITTENTKQEDKK